MMAKNIFTRFLVKKETIMIIKTKPLSDCTMQCLNQHKKTIENLEKQFGRELKIAERGKQLLVNSGAKTSALDIGKNKADSAILAHIQSNFVDNVHFTNRSSKLMNWLKKLV